MNIQAAYQRRLIVQAEHICYIDYACLLGGMVIALSDHMCIDMTFQL